MSEPDRLSDFRAEVRAWLEKNFPPSLKGKSLGIEGDTAGFGNDLQIWRERLAKRGWGAPTWPKEYGGAGLSHPEARVIGDEMARIGASNPIPMLAGMGVTMVGPTVLEYGTEDQKRRHLPGIASGAVRWCLGLSEPNAGSDLASLKTRADLRGDDLVVSGQKIWCSYAHHADWCILVVRTDPNAPKHKGLTFVLVDMKSPGITIRPLREITGEAWFNEVFFDEVRVPRSHVVGEIHRGWNVVITTLSHERGAAAPHTRLQMERKRLANLARATRHNGGHAAGDLLVRQRLAQFWIEVEILRVTAYRNVSVMLRDGIPGPQGSILKLFWSELDQRMKDTAIEILGPAGLLQKASPRAIDDGFWARELLWSRAATIYAGTSEVQRNIIAQRVLGLPR